LAVPVEVVDPHLIGLSNASGPVTANMQPTHGTVYHNKYVFVYSVRSHTLGGATGDGTYTVSAPEYDCATQKR
jgi:hypothetical protein